MQSTDFRNRDDLSGAGWRQSASYAAKLKRRRPKLGDKWFLDEVFLKINGVQHYLWRAVDQTGVFPSVSEVPHDI